MHELPDLSGVTIAFDLDGTLVDTAPDLVGALNAVLSEEGLPILPFESVRLMVGRGSRKLIERGFDAAGQPLSDADGQRLTTRFIDIYRSRIAQDSRPFPGCLQALDVLSGAGATLVVCTNKLTGLSLDLLNALEITNRFAAVIGADSAPAAKPDRRHLETAVAAAGGRMDRACLVGDSETDVGAAKAAGVPSLVATFGYTERPARILGGDHIFDHYDELPPLIGRLFA